MDRNALTDPFHATQDAINAAGLLDASCVLQLPTGAGKTFLAREASNRIVLNGLRVAYLCPLRALARELAQSWRGEPALAAAGVGVFTGEMGLDAEEGEARSPRDVAVGIYTAEKFDAYARGWEANLDWLATLDLLVVDELHLLGTGRRGATLEGVITRLRSVNPYVRVMALSATLGNRDELATWLGATPYHSDRRPIPLAWRIETFKAGTDAMRGKAEIVVDEVRRTRDQGGQSLVFVQSRPRTETLAGVLGEAGLRAAAHHAGLPRSQRERVEAAFRAGELDAIVCTPTLAVGVNLPCRKAILHDLQRFERGEWVDLDVNEVWQIAGRAGRRGLDTAGEVVLLAPQHNQKAARRYIDGRFEPIRSQLIDAAALAEQVLVVIGSGLARTEAQLQRVLARSLYAHQCAHYAAAKIHEALDAMLAAGMLEAEEGRLRATRLGRIAVRCQLSPATVRTWRAAFERLGQSLSYLDALLLVCAAAEFNARIRASEEELDFVTAACNAEPARLRSIPLGEWAALLGQRDGRELVGAAKTAVMLRAWSRGGDMNEACAATGDDPWALEEARKEAVRLLGALRLLSECDTQEGEGGAPSDEALLPERLAALQAMICTGLDEAGATLALLEGVGPKLARRLIDAGVGDIEDFALADAEEIARIDGISLARATRWIAEADAFVARGGAQRLRQAYHTGATRLVASGGEGGAEVDFYRWRRAQTLDIEPAGADFIVSGGAQPHRVAGDGSHCDCADFAKGHLCKHLIAVRHHRGDAAVPRFDQAFPSIEPVSLADLWRQSRSFR